MPFVCDKDRVTNKKPDWLKVRLRSEEKYAQVAQIVREHSLATICGSGMCPNKGECWSRRTATLMIMGEVCSRSCGFCATATGKPLPLQESEPARVARSVRLMELRHCVVTSVTRDDLPDGGAAHWARVLEAIRAENPETTLEALIPDFDGRGDLLDVFLASHPDIAGHNLETVHRITPLARSRATYEVSLRTLEWMASRGAVVKSGLMVGLGESEAEVLEALDDLRGAGCRIVTLGQYLQPTRRHLPVAEYVTPEQFEKYKTEALARGFDYVASGPLVRSSYLAEQALEHCGITKPDNGDARIEI